MSALLEDVRFEIRVAVDAGLQGQALEDAIIDRLCRRIGGQTVHWPMADRLKRAHEIRESFASGMSPRTIAKQYGVSHRTVENAITARAEEG